MNEKRRKEIAKRTDEEVKAESQHWIDTRDKTFEAIALKIKKELSK